MTAEMIVLSHIDTDTLDHEKRQDAYRVGIDNALQTVFLSDDVFADLRSCHLGPLRLISLTASPRRSERTAAQIARDRHDGISVQLVIAGRAHGHAAGRTIASDPDTIMILDFSQPFHVTDLDAREVVNVAIPRAMLARHIDDVRTLHGMVLNAERSALLAAQLRALASRLDRLPLNAASALGDMIVNLVVITLGYDPANMVLLPADRRTMLSDRARQLIDNRLGSEDLTPEWLVGQLNASRSELYAAFEDVGGIVRFIWRRRLEAARDALLDPRDVRRIGEISFALGFSSEAHFARAFRAAFGKTASAMRRERG